MTVAQAVAAVLASSAGAFAVPQVARAQEVVAPQGVLEEVIVRAQRRDQALQDVPISIQVVGADLISDTGATDMSQLNGFIPGLVVSGGSPTQPRYELRGISTGDFGIGTDPAVGVYVDGIYSARSGASLTTFNDVERVEVLKGPQGTLLGRNSAAGAVSIYTKQPTDEFDANMKIRVGEYNTRILSGMINTPIVDGLALRVTGVYNQSNGWIQDTTNKDLNPQDEASVRAILRWDVTDDTSATLSWDYDNLDQLARPAIGIVPVYAPDFDPDNFHPNPWVQYPADPDGYLNPLKLSKKVNNDVIDNSETRKLNRFNLFVDHDFGWAEFRSSTSWTKFDTNNREDEDGTALKPYIYFDTDNIEENENWYQEFKFSHSDENFDWVAGASYYSEDARQTSDTHTFTDSVDTVLVNLCALCDPLTGDPLTPQTPISPAGSLFGFTNFLLSQDPLTAGLSLSNMTWDEAVYNHGEYSAVAVFGDVIWHATDKMNVTVGLRYTNDDKHFSWLNGGRVAPQLDATIGFLAQAGWFDYLNSIGIPLTPEFYNFDLVFDNSKFDVEGVKVKAHDTWNDLSPRFVVDYRMTDDVMLWGSVAKGYKAGGYNSVEIGSVFDPENVWNVETGVKSVFPELNLLLNGSVYYYLYKDKQAISLDTTVEGGVPQYLVDTSDEQAWGVDLQAQWQPIDGLTFNAVVAFIDATYSDKTGEDDNGDPIDLSGDPTGEPWFSMSAGGDYVWDFAENGKTDLSVQWGYRGPTRCNGGSTLQGTCQISPNFKVGEAQNRTDVRLGWESEDEHWGAAAFVQNVFDQQYVDGVNNLTTNTFGTPFASITTPRQWGLEFSYQF